MPEQESHFIAYRCPKCTYSIYGVIGSFTGKKADMLKLKCQCGGSELQIYFTEDEKVRITVPCAFCGKDHIFTMSSKLYFTKDLLRVACPETHMEILFLGTKQKVDDAIEESNQDIEKLLEETGCSSFAEFQASQDTDAERLFTDAQIYDVVRYLIKDLEQQEAIDCPCHSNNYDFYIGNDGVVIYCPACGAEQFFPCESAHAAEELLAIDRIKLTQRTDT